ncbi:MAG: hypothetical protein ABI175_09490, partial [Polyangiales bacterium]
MQTPRIAAPAALSTLAVLLVLSVSAPVYAVDAFEIQVYDGTANDPGQAGLELHLNHVAKGAHVAEPPEEAPHRQTHATFEPSLGITKSWELGGYFQTALLRDGTFAYAGAKLRSKLVTAPDFHPHVRLGINVELARIPQRFEIDRWGIELRPIAAWEDDDWLFAVNPIFSFALAGKDAGAPSFEPAVAAYRKVRGLVSFGVEYYGSIGKPYNPSPTNEQLHYLYGVGNL